MATDYISREAAINEIKEDAGCNFCNLKMAACCLSCSAGKKIIRIRQMPAADVVEVVRCSVCKKVVLEDRGNGKSAFWCPVNRNYRCWDEFCSRGERMDDSGND